MALNLNSTVNGMSGIKLKEFNDGTVIKSTNNDGSTSTGSTITNLFENTKDFKDLTSYKLMRGVPDFGSLVQFTPYESGYGVFIICSMPKFIVELAKRNTEYAKLMYNWMHIVEYEFKSFDGLEGLSADTVELGDDLNKINVISKVNMQSSSSFSLTYDEKSGSPLNKFAKLYLSGIKDPRTQVKSYHGLIEANVLQPGFENEVFTFLYINTDNTMRNVESAYLLIGCQLDSSSDDMYNYQKGSIDKKEVTVKFNGYPVTNKYINNAAKQMLNYLMSSSAGARQIVVNSNDFKYTGLNTIKKTLDGYGNSDDYSSKIDVNNNEDNDKAYTVSSYHDTTEFIEEPAGGDTNEP